MKLENAENLLREVDAILRATPTDDRSSEDDADRLAGNIINPYVNILVEDKDNREGWRAAIKMAFRDAVTPARTGCEVGDAMMHDIRRLRAFIAHIYGRECSKNPRSRDKIGPAISRDFLPMIPIADSEERKEKFRVALASVVEELGTW